MDWTIPLSFANRCSMNKYLSSLEFYLAKDLNATRAEKYDKVETKIIPLRFKFLKFFWFQAKEIKKTIIYKWICKCPFDPTPDHIAFISSDHICSSDNLPSVPSVLTCYCCDKQAMVTWAEDNFEEEENFWRKEIWGEDIELGQLTAEEAFKLRTEQGVAKFIIDKRISGEEERKYKQMLKEHRALGKKTSNRDKNGPYENKEERLIVKNPELFGEMK